MVQPDLVDALELLVGLLRCGLRLHKLFLQPLVLGRRFFCPQLLHGGQLLAEQFRLSLSLGNGLLSQFLGLVKLLGVPVPFQLTPHGVQLGACGVQSRIRILQLAGELVHLRLLRGFTDLLQLSLGPLCRHLHIAQFPAQGLILLFLSGAEGGRVTHGSQSLPQKLCLRLGFT